MKTHLVGVRHMLYFQHSFPGVLSPITSWQTDGNDTSNLDLKIPGAQVGPLFVMWCDWGALHSVFICRLAQNQVDHGVECRFENREARFCRELAAGSDWLQCQWGVWVVWYNWGWIREWDVRDDWKISIKHGNISIISTIFLCYMAILDKC